MISSEYIIILFKTKLEFKTYYDKSPYITSYVQTNSSSWEVIVLSTDQQWHRSINGGMVLDV